MTLLPVADGARLLGIHPKTLCQWLKAAHLLLAIHPTDARIRCVAQTDLLEVARLHNRPLPDLSTAAPLEKDRLTGGAAALTHAAPAGSLADLLQQLSQLHTQLATVQQHLSDLTVAVLNAQTAGASALAPSSAPAPQPASRLLPVEVRARSRVTALIECGAHGQYVTVCPRLGVLALAPDSPAWFDWLATLTSFRFVGPAGRFSACRTSEKGQYTRRWAARRLFHGHDCWYYLGVTDRLTLACLEQAATALQARMDAL